MVLEFNFETDPIEQIEKKEKIRRQTAACKQNIKTNEAGFCSSTILLIFLKT